MQNEADERLLEKLSAGQCSQEELDQLFVLARRLPEDRARVVLDLLWQQSDFTQALPDRSYDRILERISPEASAAPARITPQLRSRRNLLRWASAAAILLLLTAAGLWMSRADDYLTATTGFAEQRTLTLPDGSRVQLNANSTLRFAKDWDAVEDRQVWLDGEAFFRVSKKPATGQKFRVTTPDLTVAVLGTVFNVNSNAEQTSVYLEEGKISLELKQSEDDDAKVMVPGELITYSAKQHEIIASEQAASAPVHTSWKDGVLTFEDTPLATVLERVEAIYGITFVVADSTLYDKEITAGLPMEKLDIVLPLLQQVLGVELREDGGRYLLSE